MDALNVQLRPWKRLRETTVNIRGTNPVMRVCFSAMVLSVP